MFVFYKTKEYKATNCTSVDTCTCCEEVDVDMNLYLISYCTGTIYCLVSDIVMTNLSVYTWCILSTCIGLSQVCNTCDYHGW